MKTIRWIGGVALLTAIGIAALVAKADVGDRTFIRKASLTPAPILGANKTCYINWFELVWPEVTKANVMLLNCKFNRGGCRHAEEVTESMALYAASEDSGLVAKEVSGGICGMSYAAGDMTYCKWTSWAELTAGQLTALAACIEGTWPTADGELGETLYFWRLDASNTDVNAYYHYHDAAALNDYGQLLVDGYVLKPTGWVE